MAELQLWYQVSGNDVTTYGYSITRDRDGNIIRRTRLAPRTTTIDASNSYISGWPPLPADDRAPDDMRPYETLADYWERKKSPAV